MTFTGWIIFGLLCALASPAFAYSDQHREVQAVAFGALFVFATVVVLLTLLWYFNRGRRR